MDNIVLFERDHVGQVNTIYDIAPWIDPTGDFKKIREFDVAINSIRNLLLTPLGTYPFDPEYGSLLYKKVFDPADATTAEEIDFEIRVRIQQFEDRVKLEKVDTKFFDNSKGFQVDVLISREGVTGNVTLEFPDRIGAFGLEAEDDWKERESDE